MRNSTFLTTVTTLVMLAMFSGQARAETCTVPPANAMSLASTFDDIWSPEWCGNQAEIDAIWGGLHLNVGDFDGGWGYYGVCNQWTFLNRLMSAGHVLREVEKVAVHYGENHPAGGNSTNDVGNWWQYVSSVESEGWEPWCCNSEPTLNAEYDGDFESSDLCVRWAYQFTAAQRASILVHEVTHDYQSHDDDNCGNGSSCDDYYGKLNSNTMTINFLYDAASAYQVSPVGGGNGVYRDTTKFMDGGKQMCGYVPVLPESERELVVSSIGWSLDNRFNTGSVFAWYKDAEDVDNAYGTPWNCDGCDQADYTFDSNTWKSGDKACNETLNAENFLVNFGNRIECWQFTQLALNSWDASEVASAKASFENGKQKCKSPDPDDMDAYCESEKDSAYHVSQIDEKGWLSLGGYNEEVECVVSYCEEEFQPSWSNHAGDPNWDDPRGCLDALCKNDAFCRKMFLTWEGDPDYYMRYDESGFCKEPWLHCYDDAGIVPNPPLSCGPGNGDPCVPQMIQSGQIECNLARLQCEDMLAQMLGLVEEIKDFKWLNPDFIMEAGPDPWVNPPLAYELKRQGLENDFDRGAISQTELREGMRDLYSHPEAMAALYQRDPEGFVAVLGWQGFESIAGPGIRSVEPLDLASVELNDEARAKLRSIRGLQSVEPFFEVEALRSVLDGLQRRLNPRAYDTLIDALMEAPSAMEAMGMMREADPRCNSTGGLLSSSMVSAGCSSYVPGVVQNVGAHRQ